MEEPSCVRVLVFHLKASRVPIFLLAFGLGTCLPALPLASRNWAARKDSL